MIFLSDYVDLEHWQRLPWTFHHYRKKASHSVLLRLMLQENGSIALHHIQFTASILTTALKIDTTVLPTDQQRRAALQTVEVDTDAEKREVLGMHVFNWLDLRATQVINLVLVDDNKLTEVENSRTVQLP